MLRQDTDSDDRQPRDESGGLLRKTLPFAFAFGVGFLLGRQRGGETETEEFEDEGTTVSEETSKIRSRATPDDGGATDQPSSMGSVAGEQVREEEREEGETESESEIGSEGETESEGEVDEAEVEEEMDAESEAVSEGIEGEVDEEALEGEQAEADEGEQAEAEEADESGQEAQPAGTEAAGIDEAVADLSPPTAHGMPMLGLGTYRMDDYDECVEAVRQALQMGYRHVDTAESYDNEAAVGDAIVEAEVGRDDLFLATKIASENLDYDHVLTNAADSFERLGVDFVDLLYVHWPTGEYEATDTLEAFAELREEGLIGEIGVSNFTVEQLEEAIEVSEEPIFANQVEMHPLLPQKNLRQFCAQDDVDVELVAYSPLVRGDVSDVDELREVADKHDATPAQVSLAWLREKDVTAIPKTTSEEHLRENWLSLGVELDDEDVEKLDSIDERRRVVDPDDAPWNQ